MVQIHSVVPISSQIRQLAMTARCPFCTLPPERIVLQNSHAIAIRDAYPVSPGHTLVIPKRHIASFFETTAEEKQDLFDLVDKGVRALLQSQKESDPFIEGWNIGINDGATAGQTVPHLHIHLIPRYQGDVADPRGGVRWVIPDKARYW